MISSEVTEQEEKWFYVGSVRWCGAICTGLPSAPLSHLPRASQTNMCPCTTADSKADVEQGRRFYLFNELPGDTGAGATSSGRTLQIAKI